jgi:hypothetical protein
LSRKNRSAIKEKRPETITAAKPAPPLPVSLETPPSSVPTYQPKSFPWLTVGVIAFLFVGGFAVISYWDRDPPSEPPKGIGEPTWEDSDEWALLRRFAELKTTNNPKIGDLLGVEPVIPDMPISASEATTLQTEVYLRQPFVVEKIRPEGRETAGPQAQFALVVQGTVNAPGMKVSNGTTVDEVKRVVYNPEIIVRVEGGKIIGLKTQMRGESRQQPMTPAQERRFREALGGK